MDGWDWEEKERERGFYFSGKRAMVVVALVSRDGGGVLIRFREAGGGREAAKPRTIV